MLIGYKRAKDNNCKFEIDEYSSKIVQKIFKMRLNGIRPTMIARSLTDEKISPPSIYSGRNIKKTFTTYLWSVSTINQILTNPIYTGDLIQRKYDKVNYKSKKKVKLCEDDWIVTKDCVPPIISRADFEIVQNMKRNNIKRCSSGYDYLLKGLVVCGDCGKTMSVRKRINKRKTKADKVEFYYCCSNYIRYRNSVCSLHYFREDKLNKIIINYLKTVFSKYIDISDLRKLRNYKEKRLKEINGLKSEIVKFNKKVESITKALKELFFDKSNNIISQNEFTEIKTELEKDKEVYINKIIELNKIIKNINLNNNASGLEKNINEFIELKSPTKQMIMSLIHKIEITKDKKIKIFVNFNLNVTSQS